MIAGAVTMGWKNWPYWLRGGIVCAVLVLIVFIISAVLGYFKLGYFGQKGIGGILSYFAIFGIIISIPIELIVLVTNVPIERYPNYVLYIFVIVIWFIIGALIGWIVKKIKNR